MSKLAKCRKLRKTIQFLNFDKHLRKIIVDTGISKKKKSRFAILGTTIETGGPGWSWR